MKLRRADQHIANFDQRLRQAEDANTPVPYLDPQTGEEFIKCGLSDPFLAVDLALIFGDAIHNLHSALDFCWHGVLKRLHPSSVGDNSKFPICDRETKLIGDLKNTVGLSPDSALYGYMVNHLKSYKGGNSVLWDLHRLDIDDKHRLIIPVVSVGRITGIKLQNEKGTIQMTDWIVTRVGTTYKAPVPQGSKVKDYGHITIRVLLSLT